MLEEKNFFDFIQNESDKRVSHQYDVIELGGVRFVIDNTTNLTWQQSGSPDYLTFADAEKYVRDLNDKRFGGYSDWRLPTLEEAMTLMESKKNGKLYIDPVFDQEQTWIWTSDKRDAGVAWVVYFNLGSCDGLDVHDNLFVRAVR